MSHTRFKHPKPIGKRGATVTLPAPGPHAVEFTRYLADQFYNTTRFLRSRSFIDLIGAIDSGYQAVRSGDVHLSPGLARLFIVCHQAFFSAASSIARGLPLDASAASRRAIEAARTALALKLNPQFGDKWVAFETRSERWRARQSGHEVPKIRLNFGALKGDAVADQLARLMGMFSDAGVHFTREFLG